MHRRDRRIRREFFIPISVLPRKDALCGFKIVTKGNKIMVNVAGIRFKPSGRVHYFDPGSIDLSLGDRVLVETDNGPREGTVVIPPSQMLYSDLRGPMERVLQRAED
jgi:hypothetical protein